MENNGSGVDKYEFQLGMKELALIFSGCFLVIVLVFTLGMMVSKELYGADASNCEEVAMTAVTDNMADETDIQQDETEEPDEDTSDEQPKLDFMDELKTPAQEDKPKAKEPDVTPEIKPMPPKDTDTVKKDEPKDEADDEFPPMPSGDWTIQVAASKNLDEAEKLAKKLAEEGYPARVEKFKMADASWSRVRVGWFKTKDEALNYMSEIKAKGVIPPDSFVVER